MLETKVENINDSTTATANVTNRVGNALYFLRPVFSHFTFWQYKKAGKVFRFRHFKNKRSLCTESLKSEQMRVI